MAPWHDFRATGPLFRPAVLIAPACPIVPAEGGGAAQPPSEPPARPPRRRRWPWVAALIVVLIPVVLVATLLAAASTERGTRWLWQAALVAAHGKLSGQWHGGTLASGIHLRQVAYRDGATQIAIDRLDGRWRLQRGPWRFTVDWLRVGHVDARFAPSPPKSSEPLQLPKQLTLPLGVTIDEISMAQLTLHDPELTISDLLLRGRTDGRHHALTLAHVVTPYGTASADVHLDGMRPFMLDGNLALSTEYQGTPYQVTARLGGSLEALAVDANASGGKLAGQVHVEATPFGTVPLKRAHVIVTHLNPQVFAAAAPQADLALQADLAPVSGGDPLRVGGSVSITNAEAGPLDRARLPLVSARADVVLDARQQRVSGLDLRLAGGAVLSGDGELNESAQGGAPTGRFALQVDALDLRSLHAKLPASRLSGPLVATLDSAGQHVTLDWRDAARRIQVDTDLTPQAIVLKRAALSAGHGALVLTGKLAQDATRQYEAKAALSNFDPRAWFATGAAGAARVNGTVAADGTLGDPLTATVKFALHDSVYADLPMTGTGTVALRGERVLPSDARLSVAGNQIALKGAFGAPGDRLAVNVDAPQLGRLGFGMGGALKLSGTVDGTFKAPNVRATFAAHQLVFGAHKLASLDGQADVQGGLHAGASGRLGLTLDARGYEGSGVSLAQASVRLAGTRGQHDVTASAEGKLHGQPLALAVAAAGTLTDGAQGFGWKGTVRTLHNRGLPAFSLDRPWQVAVGANKVTLGATHFTLADAAIELGGVDYDHGALRTQGAISALDVGKVLALVKTFTGEAPPLQSDLVLDGRWNITLARQADGFVQIERRRGDVAFDGGRDGGGGTALGISALHLRADLQANRVNVDARLAASRIGTLSAQAQTTLAAQNGGMTLPDSAPLSGNAVLDVPDLNTVGDLAGPQYLLKGKAGARLRLGGTAGRPQLSGEIQGDNLSVTLFDLGIQLRDGTVRIALDNNVIDLRQVVFHGGDGTIKAGGRIELGGSDPSLAAIITADKLQLFAAPDRTLVLSGQAKITNPDHQLGVDGKFTVDHALFDLPPASAPALGDDVVIVHNNGQAQAARRDGAQAAARAAEKPASRFAPRIDLDVDLGRDFRFKGSGADLRLRGAMHVHSAPLQAMRATGTIRVAQGTYEAFDRKLEIEQGTINFDGPIDNPNIFIRALRRNQDVEAGVQVTGTVRQPRVELVSEPNVSQEEKLSWLMFGHGPDSGGLGQQQAAGAALAMLGSAGGKQIVKNFGIDQFSIGPSESGLPDQQVVNLGKAITEKLSVGYEQSLTSAASIAKLTWQLSRRWQIVAGGGSINSLDIFFNRRFD